MVKRKRNETIEGLHSSIPDLKENQFINKNQNPVKISDPGEEYLFPYWDEYWDESEK
jgi:hypothetical protein